MNTNQKQYNTSVSSGLVEGSSLTDGEAILHTVTFFHRNLGLVSCPVHMWENSLGMRLRPGKVDLSSLVPRPLITANVVEGLVKLLRRMTSGGCLEAWHFW